MPRLPPPPAEQMRLESLAEVARGGMGSVELARVVDGRLTGQILAVKRLHANIAEDPEFVAMFLDEACITAALRHPNVAQVVAWGNDEAGTFLAIELVQGVSLSRLLKEAQTNQEPFAERTVAFICSQICAGLVAAHGLTMPDGTPLGVVHRDLTPGNILVSFDGAVKIIDFGIAKAEERITHTRTGQLKGKPSYMAPEQQRGGNVDLRADLFAFGVTMFELLAGRRPWMSKGAFDVMMEIASDPHPDLGELRKGLNPEFVEIAHRCLEKKAEARFNSAGEIKARLDAWLSAKGFTSDDQQSLAHFVQRNSQPQIKWWQEALRGEHAKKKAPTFKELEEKIDAERERAAKGPKPAPPPRPAAGASGPKPPVPATPVFTGTHPIHPGPQSGAQPASGPASIARPRAGTQPMAAYPAGGPTSGRPSLAQPPTPYPVSSGPVSSGPATPPSPSSGQPYAPPSSGPQHASMIGPSPTSQHHPLSGTEFMGAMPGSQPAPRMPDQNPLASTEYMGSMPVSVSPSYAPPPMPTGDHGGYPGAAPPVSMVMPRPMPTIEPHPLSQRIVSAEQQAMTANQAAPQSTVPPARKRGKLGLVLVLVAIPIIGAGASAWIFRDALLNLGGTNATRSAPAGKR